MQAQAAARSCRRPWLCFLSGSLLLVVLVAGGGPVLSAIKVSTADAPPRRRAAAEYKLIHHSTSAAATRPPPPPTPTLAPSNRTLTDRRAVDGRGAADPGGARRVEERSPWVQAMIEAGFSRAQAEVALQAVGAKGAADVARAIEWSLKKDAERNKLEAAVPREIHTFDKMDFDGYALMWGDKHRTRTLEECGTRCLSWKPQPPAYYACNIFVFCPMAKCFAPAALPPGSMTGQCWLKHQEDPNNPQVNMKGDYSAAYIKRHAGAPASVQWQAGVVVRNGSSVDTSTWSSRANW